jgi:hypothetical protein
VVLNLFVTKQSDGRYIYQYKQKQQARRNNPARRTTAACRAQMMTSGVADLTNEELQLCKKAFAQFDKDGERPAPTSAAVGTSRTHPGEPLRLQGRRMQGRRMC